MRTLIALGMLVAFVAFAGTAFADGGAQDRELQKLFEWSAQAFKSSNPGAQAANPGGQVDGPAAQPTKTVPPVMDHQGSRVLTK